MSVIVTGSLGFDYIMDFPGKFADRIMPDKIHKISLSFLVDSLKKQFGGTAGNIAYTLHLLGINPRICSAAGNDFSAYKEFLERHGIKTTGIKIIKTLPTGSYFVVTDLEDNQIGSFYAGAMGKNDLVRLPLKKTDTCQFVVISPNDPNALRSYVKHCIKNDIPFMYDPAFQIGSLEIPDLHAGVAHAAILIGNDYEIALIEKRLEISHEKLLDVCPIIVTTLGAKGSVIEEKRKKYPVAPAETTSIIDPTGAGDAYRGGFLAGYLRSYDLTTCGQMGSVAAAYTVEKYGTMTHGYTKKEFLKRYKENFHQAISLSDVM